MAFGVYIHIPHCLQVCPYCDFTKYERDKIMPLEQYVSLVCREIQQRAHDIGNRFVDTIYFGGGTPSLLQPEQILALLRELANHGFQLCPDAEITIEINPGTVDREKLERYLDLGINRFSVGAQTFNERLLKIAGRKHSAHETVETLQLLKEKGVNYSFDLLFALPTQTTAELDLDLAQATAFDPSHLSAYYLTVPEQHPMSRGRAPEDEQIAMFDLIENRLAQAGLRRYELSSYAKPGRESRHNHLYWTDEEFWGLGVSSHSYLKRGAWGTRFWNPVALPAYVKQVDSETSRVRTLSSRSNHQEEAPNVWLFPDTLPEEQIERLEAHQALTDFCHVRLRMIRGLNENALRLRFGETVARDVVTRLHEIAKEGLVEINGDFWGLSRQGRLLSNVVFEKLTFLTGDISSR